MIRALACAFALALATVAGPAFAQDDPVPGRVSTEARVPNMVGASGLFFNPSAYTQGPNSASAFFSGHADFIGGGVLFGVGNRFEIGGTVLGIDDDLGGDTEFLLNAKFNLLPERSGTPALSVGIIDAFDSLDVDTSWYVVASKYFGRRSTDANFALKLHLGYGGGIFDDTIFAGGELFFTPQLSLIAELNNSDFNVGGRWIHRNFAATVGWFDFKNIGGNLSYLFSF